MTAEEDCWSIGRNDASICSIGKECPDGMAAIDQTDNGIATCRDKKTSLPPNGCSLAPFKTWVTCVKRSY